MAEEHDVFTEDQLPRHFADAPAREASTEDDFQEFWEIVQCMSEEGWESAIAAWESADARRSDAKTERKTLENQLSATSEQPADRIGDVLKLKEENLGPDGKPAIPMLLELLQDQDERVRFLAAGVLGGIGSEAATAIPALADLRNDESMAVSRVAAKAIKKIEAEKK